MKFIFGVVFSLFLFNFVGAQALKVPTLSPRCEISQEVGLTDVKISYSRPSAKGREIFGGLVPTEEIWRTGANAATTVTFSEEVTMANKTLPAGTYAIYTIPNSDIWTIIIHSKTDMRSLDGNYKEENDVMRFGVIASNSLIHTETFTIDINDITTSSFNITMSWANKIAKIPVKLNVDNQVAAQMEELANNPEGISHRDYFKAAEYDFHNKDDHKKAYTYIRAALDADKENPRYGLLKAKIENKAGMFNTAMETVRQANNWARVQGNTNYINQTVLFSKEMSKQR